MVTSQCDVQPCFRSRPIYSKSYTGTKGNSSPMPLKVGDIAPEFELPAVIGEDRTTFRLADHRGKKNVVLAFYPLDWTSTCTNHIPTYQTALEQLAKLD